MAVRPCVRLSSNRVIFLCQAAARSMDASCEVNLKVCRLPIQAKMCRAASQRKKKKRKNVGQQNFSSYEVKSRSACYHREIADGRVSLSSFTRKLARLPFASSTLTAVTAVVLETVFF